LVTVDAVHELESRKGGGKAKVISCE
jgi:hypothetical protein